MSRIIGPTTLKKLSEVISEISEEVTYFGDLSDFGNEIGVAIGEMFPNMTEQEISEVISGLRHGISLTNETH